MAPRARHAPPPAGEERSPDRGWTFLTNHAHVLLCIAAEPDIRLRTVAQRVGITERAAQLIVTDLVAAGYLTRIRVGRRNHYTVHRSRPFRHPLEAAYSIDVLLDLTSAAGSAAHGSAAG